MKAKILSLLLVVMLVITSCSGPSVDKGLSLLDDGKIDEAIEVFEGLVDEDEMNFDAWFGIVESYIEDEEYEDAADTLEEIYEVVEDNYDEEDEDVDYEEVVDDIVKYAEDIIDEGGEMGDWFANVVPAEIDVTYYDGSMFYVDDTLYLDVPEGADVYYNLTGDKVSTEDEKYDAEDGIVFEEEGEFELVVAVINGIGIKGEESEAEISVTEGTAAIGGGDGGTADGGTTDGGNTPADGGTTTPSNDGEFTSVQLETSLPAGTYPSTIMVEITGYDVTDANVSAYYTIDGSTPDNWSNWYYEGMEIEFGRGEHTLKAVAYDSQKDEYSQVLTVNYSVEATPTSASDIYIAAYDISDGLFEEFQDLISDIRYYEDINVYVDRVYDGEELESLLNSSMPPDMIYGDAAYAIALEGYVDDMSNYISPSDYTYYDNVLDSVFYKDAYYCMPVAIRPTNILYHNYFELSGDYANEITWDEFAAEIEGSSTSYGFAFPQDDMLGFFGYYAGFGGGYSIDYSGYANFEYEPLVEAFTFARDLSTTYDFRYTGLDDAAYEDAFVNGNSMFILSSPSDYYDSDMAYDYEPLGLMPLPNGSVAKSPLEVFGLFTTLSITPEKADAIKEIYELLILDTYYSYYMYTEDECMSPLPEMKEDYYEGPFYEDGVYENIIENSSVMPLDLMDTLIYYTDAETIVNNVMSGVVSPEEGAQLLIDDVDAAYH